ncbi:sodium/pantothenate symporter [Roseivirga sp. BDSF3-8]|uniref:sodium/pantothenate symporter n=1 Tax=Roseivirga sp. BDSF3-8 TaxID=3241598 RepID=UPI003531C8FD
MASQELVTAGWVLITLYLIMTLWFVIRGARSTKSIADYAVGSIAFSPVAVGLSLAASMTSAATFIINPGFVAYYGISGIISMAIMLPLGALISLVIFTKGFKKVGNAIKALTMAQWIGARYNNKAFATFFAFLSLLLITFVVLICVGLTKVLSGMLNTPETYTLLAIVAVIFGYMMFGGANSMVYTNMIQALLMIIVAVVLLTSGLDHFRDGINGFMDKLAAIDPLLVKPLNEQSPLFRDLFEVVFCQIVVGIAIVCQPHIITKSLLLKSDGDVNKFLVTGIVVEVLFFFVVAAGLYARIAFPDLTIAGETIGVDGIISAYVVQEFTVAVGLLVIMGLISAGISTLEGLIQSLSTTVTADILLPVFFKNRKENVPVPEVFINRLVIVGLALLAFFFSYRQLMAPDLSVGIFAQNGVYAYFSAAFIPVLFGTFVKNVRLIVPVAGAITAVVVHFSVYYGRLTPYMQEGVRNPGVAAALAICSSVLVSLLIHAVVRTRNNAPSKTTVNA